MRLPPTLWKNLALLALALVLGALLLEGGAYLLQQAGGKGPALPIAFVPAQPGQPALPESTGPNEGDLHTIHLPDQWVWWKVKPGLLDYHVTLGWDKEHDFHLSTSPQGYRRTGADAAPDARRILVAGDSTAFGVGVDDGDTWPARLEALLSARGGPPVDVVNSGVPGYSTFQAVRMAEKYGLYVKPALVIVCAGFNDTAPTPAGELPDLERAEKNERDHAAGQPASAFLALVARAAEGAQRLAPGEQRPRLSRDEYLHALDGAEAFFRERGIPLLWVRWPTQDEVNTGQPAGAGYPDALLEFIARPGMHGIDLMPVFKAATETPYYDFVHANTAGNALAATALADALTGMGW